MVLVECLERAEAESIHTHTHTFCECVFLQRGRGGGRLDEGGRSVRREEGRGE